MTIYISHCLRGWMSSNKILWFATTEIVFLPYYSFQITCPASKTSSVWCLIDVIELKMFVAKSQREIKLGPFRNKNLSGKIIFRLRICVFGGKKVFNWGQTHLDMYTIIKKRGIKLWTVVKWIHFFRFTAYLTSFCKPTTIYCGARSTKQPRPIGWTISLD